MYDPENYDPSFDKTEEELLEEATALEFKKESSEEGKVDQIIEDKTYSNE